MYLYYSVQKHQTKKNNNVSELSALTENTNRNACTSWYYIHIFPFKLVKSQDSIKNTCMKAYVNPLKSLYYIDSIHSNDSLSLCTGCKLHFSQGIWGISLQAPVLYWFSSLWGSWDIVGMFCREIAEVLWEIALALWDVVDIFLENPRVWDLFR